MHPRARSRLLDPESRSRPDRSVRQIAQRAGVADRHVPGGVAQDVLHFVRFQARLPLQDERADAGHFGGGRRGAAEKRPTAAGWRPGRQGKVVLEGSNPAAPAGRCRHRERCPRDRTRRVRSGSRNRRSDLAAEGGAAIPDGQAGRVGGIDVDAADRDDLLHRAREAVLAVARPGDDGDALRDGHVDLCGDVLQSGRQLGPADFRLPVAHVRRQADGHDVGQRAVGPVERGIEAFQEHAVAQPHADDMGARRDCQDDRRHRRAVSPRCLGRPPARGRDGFAFLAARFSLQEEAMVECEVRVEDHHPHAGTVEMLAVNRIGTEERRYLTEEAQRSRCGCGRRPVSDRVARSPNDCCSAMLWMKPGRRAATASSAFWSTTEKPWLAHPSGGAAV